MLRFLAPIEIRGINPFVRVTAKQAARLKPDWRKPMPVRIQVNGKPNLPWCINMMPAGDGTFYLYLHGQVRKASGTGVGDLVRLTVVFDNAYDSRSVGPMPSWFRHALLRNQAARNGWDGLSPSRQKEILRYLARLKSPEARQRNLHKALLVLAGGKARFMARSWNTDKPD